MLKKCFGIPSWLPNEEEARKKRIDRLNKLFKQLNDLWPDIDILVIAQNWKDFKPIETANKQIIKIYPELGLLKARHTLREEFLKLDYDYIIMFDDDAIIETKDNAHIKFMEELDKHPQGFCFIHGHNSAYHPYCAAQLNLCAISRFIYEKEPMVDIDPQKNEGYEDSIYACLLHHKYSSFEFNPPQNIRCTQFGKMDGLPSTWARTDGQKRPFIQIGQNTNRIQSYIALHKKFPKNYKEMIIVKESKFAKQSKTYMGDKDNYWGF